MTIDGDTPNHVMVKNYILAEPPYEGAGKHARIDIRSILQSVAFQKGHKGSTNMDRWINYLQIKDADHTQKSTGEPKNLPAVQRVTDRLGVAKTGDIWKLGGF